MAEIKIAAPVIVDRELLSAQKELLAHAFGQAQAYTNVVLAAGYAGFFAIWSFLKPELSKVQIFWSALLVSVSLATFILWEVYQVSYRSRSLLSLARAVDDPARFHEHMLKYRQSEQDRLIELKRLWVGTYAVTVLTGFAGVGVLLWAFVQTLWRHYLP